MAEWEWAGAPGVADMAATGAARPMRMHGITPVTARAIAVRALASMRTRVLPDIGTGGPFASPRMEPMPIVPAMRTTVSTGPATGIGVGAGKLQPRLFGNHSAAALTRSTQPPMSY